MAKKEKYYNNKNKKFSDDNIMDQFKKFIIIVSVIVGIILLLWFIIELKNGTFAKKDTVEENTTTTIQYDEIMAGQTFNRKDSEYYVIFADSDKEFYSIYRNYIATYSEKNIYLVDISNPINSKYISAESNVNAQSSNELKVKDNTLIKISNGKNILYLEGYKEVINEIKN